MLLEQAITAIETGDKQTGKQLLAEVLKADPRNENAWLWMTEVVDSDNERLMCLRNVLKINAGNELAQQKLATLQQTKKKVEAGQPASASAISLQTPKGNLVLDFEQEQVTLNGEQIVLAPVELELLYTLARYRGRVVSYDLLLTEVWDMPKGKATPGPTKNMEKYIYFLRRRFEEEPSSPSFIQHEEGVGYRLG